MKLFSKLGFISRAGVATGSLLIGQRVYADDSAGTPTLVASEEPATGKVRRRRKRKKRLARNQRLRNPGLFERIADEAQIHFEQWEGAKVNVRALNMQPKRKEVMVGLTANLTPPSQMKRETASTLFTSHVCLHDKHILVAFFDPATATLMEGRLHTEVAKNIKLRTSCFVAKDRYVYSADLDYLGNDFTSTLTASGQLPGVSLNYLQSITPTMALGASIAHAPLMGTLLSGAFRYQTPKGQQTFPKDTFVAEVKVSDWTGKASYKRDVNEHLSLATDFALNRTERRTVVPSASFTASYSYMMFNYHAKIDSSGTVAVGLDQSITPAIGILFNSSINQLTDDIKLGVGARVQLG